MSRFGVLMGVAVCLLATTAMAQDISSMGELEPITKKPRPTQVEPEVLASLRAAKANAAAKRQFLDHKTVAMANNLGWPDTEPYATVAGRVVKPNGRPMADAAVVLMDTNGNLMAQGHTDFSGWYEVTELQEGPYVIQVVPSARDAAWWAQTWYPANRSFLRAEVLDVRSSGTNADVTVQRGTRLFVTLVDARRPVAGAAVKVCGESYLDCQAATSDERGRVVFTGMPVSPVRIAVTTTAGSRYEFASEIRSAGRTILRLDTENGKLVARGGKS